MLRNRIREIAETRVRYGYRRIHILLQREGWSVGRTRVYRLHRLEGLCEELLATYRIGGAYRMPPMDQS